MDNNANYKTVTETRPVSAGTKALRAVFPWFASAYVLGGALGLGWFENKLVTDGHFSSFAYLAYAAIAGLLFVIHHNLYRD